MASDCTPFCTDEELLQELKKLGYNDVSAETFLMVKKDLFELMLQKKKVPINWQNYHELTSYKNLKYPDQSRNVVQPTAFLPGRSPTFVVDPDKTSPINHTSSSAYVPDIPQSKAENLKAERRIPSQNLPVQKLTKNHSLPTSSHISDSSPSECQSGNYKSKESSCVQSSSTEKQPENYSLPSNSRVLSVSPKKFNFMSKGKTQQKKPFIGENDENVLPPSSSVSNASPKIFDFMTKGKTQQQKPFIGENDENVLPPSSSVSNASPKIFNFRKSQRQPLIEEDAENTNSSSNSSIPNASPNRNKYENCKIKGRIQRKNRSEEIEQDNRASYSSSHEANSIINDRENSNIPSQSSISEEDHENTDAISDNSKSNDSIRTSISNISFEEYRERLKTFKAGRESKSLGLPDKRDTSSVSLEGNKIKRKVLRHKNGKPVVTEEYIEIPSIFNTSSSNNSNTSVSSNSSGSLSAASPETSDTPRSTDSLSSSRSVLSRSMAGKKKSDPVAMYHYYKKFWNEHKPPGEKSHGKLRWAVRDRMLEYSL